MSKWIALVLVTITACSSAGSQSDLAESGSGAESPESAVGELLEHLGQGEFSAAVPFAVPGQSALASLAEGASVADVAEGLRDGDGLIADNFWTGFAQSVSSWLDDNPQVTGSETVTTEGQNFEVVTVSSDGDIDRIFIAKEDDGYRVDTFATFGPSLASRLYPQVERLFDSAEEDAPYVLAQLREQVPSLHMAAQTPGLAPNVVQDILLLIELITRIN